MDSESFGSDLVGHLWPSGAFLKADNLLKGFSRFPFSGQAPHSFKFFVFFTCKLHDQNALTAQDGICPILQNWIGNISVRPAYLIHPTQKNASHRFAGGWCI